MRILFICHGNICRSPTAEFIMKYLTREAGVYEKFVIASAATSTDDLGSDMYSKAKSELNRHKIPHEHRKARQLRSNEYSNWDLIIAMDDENLRDILSILGGDPCEKVRLLMSFAGENRSVEDPWYTRNFAKAYDDIYNACSELLAKLSQTL